MQRPFSITEMLKTLATFSAIFISFHLISAQSLSCRDENGIPVDWFYLYKLPYQYPLSDYSTESEIHGMRYLFISSQSNTNWNISDKFINSSNSFPGQTLSPVLNNSDVLLIAYNDEDPNGQVNFNNGHTKGVVAADSKSGFWLIHSVPKYPEIGNYSYPKTGLHYGQSFLCISLNASQLNIVGFQQIFNEPNVYYHHIPNNLIDKYPNLVKAANKEWKMEAPYWNEAQLESVGGTNFFSFAKGSKFDKELYEDWVAPALNVNLNVETWRHGPGNLPSNCSRKNHVLNVKEIEISIIDFTFNSTADHSKWSVSDGNEDNWICVGDINRAEHQLKRGGGTVCQLNPSVAQAYRRIIKECEPCTKMDY